MAAKEQIKVVSDPVSEAAEPLEWEVVGLQKSDSMPVTHEGRTYNLASLTPEQAAYLLEQGPEKMPYLRRK